MIATQRETVVFAEPPLNLSKACPAFLALTSKTSGASSRPWTYTSTSCPLLRKAAGAGKRIAFRMDAKRAVKLDDLALDAIAFAAVPDATHRDTTR